VGADDAHREAALAGQQQRLVHLVEGLVERLDLAHALVARQVAPAAARVQEPLALVAVVLVPEQAPPGATSGNIDECMLPDKVRRPLPVHRNYSPFVAFVLIS
jgi:hypothetical protein